MAFITAKTGKNVKALLNLSQSLYKQAHKRVGTGTLNRVLREAVEAHPPASRENRTPRIYYATQVDVAPPTIVLFVNSTRLFDPTYQRYLLNVFREKLPFHDVPIKLYLRSRKQAEPGAARPRTTRSADEVVDTDRSGSGRAARTCARRWIGPVHPVHQPRGQRTARRPGRLKPEPSAARGEPSRGRPTRDWRVESTPEPCKLRDVGRGSTTIRHRACGSCRDRPSRGPTMRSLSRRDLFHRTAWP